MKSRCSVFVSSVQNENKETYTVSFILIFQLSILKQNQKSPRFSQLLWMSKDITFFFLSLVLKTWIYRTQHRDQNINNRNRILISVCDENQISKKSTKTPSRGGECKFAHGRRAYREPRWRPLPDFIPGRTRYESVNYGISSYWST